MMYVVYLQGETVVPGRGRVCEQEGAGDNGHVEGSSGQCPSAFTASLTSTGLLL